METSIHSFVHDPTTSKEETFHVDSEANASELLENTEDIFRFTNTQLQNIVLPVLKGLEHASKQQTRITYSYILHLLSPP